jgi:hypothetical protein
VDGSNDVDSDNICEDEDSCPFDTMNDQDSDALCGNVDSCATDAANDMDSDSLCASNDSCQFDEYDDIDGDSLCADVDSCPFDLDNDIDSDSLCSDVYASRDVATLMNLQQLCFAGTFAKILSTEFDIEASFDSETSIFDLDPITNEVTAVVYMIIQDSTSAISQTFASDLQSRIATELEWDSSNILVKTKLVDTQLVVQRRMLTSAYVLEIEITIVFVDCFNDAGGFDADSDVICFKDDSCPYDAANDADGDLLCESGDSCPFDPNNDMDGDGLCNSSALVCFDDTSANVGFGNCTTYVPQGINGGNCVADGMCNACGCSCLFECSDPCPLDSFNDNDSDNICGDIDSCPHDAMGDRDSDSICGGADSCAMDSYNDIDDDHLCMHEDSCPYDADNDRDSDSICGDLDSCPDSANNFPGCGLIDASINDNTNDLDSSLQTWQIVLIVVLALVVIVVVVIAIVMCCRKRKQHGKVKPVMMHSEVANSKQDVTTSVSSKSSGEKINNKTEKKSLVKDSMQRGYSDNHHLLSQSAILQTLVQLETQQIPQQRQQQQQQQQPPLNEQGSMLTGPLSMVKHVHEKVAANKIYHKYEHDDAVLQRDLEKKAKVKHQQLEQRIVHRNRQKNIANDPGEKTQILTSKTAISPTNIDIGDRKGNTGGNRGKRLKGKRAKRRKRLKRLKSIVAEDGPSRSLNINE